MPNLSLFDPNLFPDFLEQLPSGVAYCKMVYSEESPYDFIFLYTNTSFLTQTGLSELNEKRVSNLASRVFDANPELVELFVSVANGGPTEIIEVYFSSLRCWFSIKCYSPKPEYFIAIFDNITERKQAKEALTISDSRYRKVLDDQTEIIFRFKRDGVILYVNLACANFFGIPREKLIGNKWQPIAYAEDLPLIQERLNLLTPKNPVVTIENRVIAADGNIHWMQFINHAFFDEHGETMEMQSVGRDISEQKGIQQKLMQAQYTFKTVFRTSPTGIALIRQKDNQYIDANDAYLHIFDRQYDELIASTASGIGLLQSSTNSDNSGASQFDYEPTHKENDVVILTKSGESRHISIARMSAILGGEDFILEFICDITEHKRYEKQMLRYKTILNTTNDGFWVVNSTGYIKHVNQTYVQMSGYSVSELLSMRVADLDILETIEEIERHIAKIKKNGFDFFETQHRRKCGKIFDVEVSVNYLEETDECFAFFRDISEKKINKKQLEDNYKLFHSVFNNVAVGIAQVSLTGQILQINDEYCRIIGYSLAEIHAKNLTHVDITHPDDVEPDLGIRILSGEIKRYTREKRYIRKDGSVLWASICVQMIMNESDQNIYLIASAVDINERKKAEAELSLSEDKFSKIFKNSPIGIGISRLADGTFIDVNQAFLDFYEYKREEIIGSTSLKLNLWAYPEQRSQMLRQLQTDGCVSNMEVIGKCKSGREANFLANTEQISIAGDACMLGFIIDITDRKVLESERQKLYLELEERVNQRTKELQDKSLSLRQLAAKTEQLTEIERRKMAIEVHDELGQNLTALRMQAAILPMLNCQNQDSLQQQTDKMLTLIDGLIEQVRNVSTNLYPIVLDIGFDYAMNWLVSKFKLDSNISCKISIVNRNKNVDIPNPISVGIFRIAQESLTNIKRHAQASKVKIKIIIEKQNLVMEINDNGKGFDTNALKKGQGFGIFGMHERMLALNAELNIESVLSKGTTIFLRVPLTQVCQLKK